MLAKVLVRATVTFAAFHLLQYFAFYLLSATFYDGPLFVGLPFKVYTVSCGFAFQPAGCQWRSFSVQNLVIDQVIWLLVWTSISYLKSRLSKKQKVPT